MFRSSTHRAHLQDPFEIRPQENSTKVRPFLPIVSLRSACHPFVLRKTYD
jgi:hypothetical protein